MVNKKTTIVTFRIFNFSNKLSTINFLHFFNDGFEASFVLLLPFIAKELHINLTQVGLLGTVLNICGVILAFYSGIITTKLGGIKSLLYILLLSTLIFVGTGFISTFSYLITLFALAGVGYGLFHPICWSLISYFSTKETRGKAMGDSTAVGEIGRIGLSTILTFIIVAIGWRVTSILYGIVGLVISLIIYRLILADKTLHEEPEPIAKVKITQLFNNKQFIYSVLVLIFDVFAGLSIYIFLPFLFLKQGIAISFIGVFTAIFFIGNFFGKLFLGRFSDKYGNTILFLISETIMAVSIFLLAHSTFIPLVLLFALLLGVFTKGTVPIVGSMIAESVEHHGDFNKTFSVTESISSFVRVVAPVVLGFIADKLGIISAFNTMAIIAFIALFPALGFQFSKEKSNVKINK